MSTSQPATQTQPFDFPKMIFILSNRESRVLACEVVAALEAKDPKALSWDFEALAHEALEPLIEVDFGHDMGDPRENSPEIIDHVEAMVKFIEERFGPSFLPTRTLTQYKEHRNFTDDTVIFRDATWDYIKPFVETYKAHQYLIVNLLPIFGRPNEATLTSAAREMGRRILDFASPTVETVVKAIEEAS